MIRCDYCPAAVDTDRETAKEEGWLFSHESAEWMCPCCYAEAEQKIEREYGYLRPYVKAANDARREGDSAAAELIRRACV